MDVNRGHVDRVVKAAIPVRRSVELAGLDVVYTGLVECCLGSASACASYSH